jgi:hypothetical protein
MKWVALIVGAVLVVWLATRLAAGLEDAVAEADYYEVPAAR